MPRGKLVAFDGIDGSGKDTQLEYLRETLPSAQTMFTYEPGGTDFANLIRSLLMRAEPESTPMCDFFLFWASRAAHIEDFLEPALDQGFNVMTNRYASSTWAFQICGEEQRQLEPLFRTVHSMLPGMLVPDAYFIFDLPAEIAYERMKARAQKEDPQEQTRYDLKPIDYHQRVRDGFREFGAFALETGSQFFLIDANRDEKTIQAELWFKLQGVLNS